ncbi:hypothetical protein A9Z42_0037140 [Trichoderma parareesei]|uniref:Uncharacterized protein n=1 Tax=Trichoderma parareesei TaxID=858221 RepID=A0A2H2ZB79_TRIPA|nr:hypothetical protein A9Z42_0037140 [Trichoderma parareesei]
MADQSIERQEESFKQRQAELCITIRQHEDEIRALRAKERSLRDFVLDSNSDEVVSGDDILCRFAGLRQKIQRISFSKTYRLGRKMLPLLPKGDSFDPSLEELWAKSRRSSRRLILRSVIFQFLHDSIFSHETFDFDDSRLESTRGLADALGRFERTMVDQGVPQDAVVDWRLSTFKCIERARLGGKVFGGELRTDIYRRFSHFIATDASQQERMKLADGYQELCKEAWDLQLLMRRSREPYQCRSIRRPSAEGLKSWEEVFEEISAEGTGDGMTFTLFGALIKESRIPGEEPKILERAQVIATATGK